jgi:hypothetical protein
MIKKWVFIFSLIITIFILFITYNFLKNSCFANKNKNKKENFTSGFRMMYRPHMRRIRLFGENYYNQFTNNMQLIFRKIGLF